MTSEMEGPARASSRGLPAPGRADVIPFEGTDQVGHSSTLDALARGRVG